MRLRIIFFLLFPTIAFGQKINSTEQGGQQNIYNDAIKRYLTYVAEVDNINLDTLLVEKNEVITDSLQTRINGVFLEIVDWSVINDKLDRENEIVLYKLFPLQFDKGIFSISIVPYSTTKKEGEMNLANGGACRVIYSFNSSIKNFKFVKVDCWGI